MSSTTSSNWEMQAGDPATFAFRLAFLRNPHGDEDRAATEERESWGSFAVWTQGENLCAHLEQGEVIGAAHWYMLPLIEWLADNWDALLHEERLPLSNVGLSSAESLSFTKTPLPSLKEIDEFAWLDTWAAWWSRHSVRACREGGLFPDLYLRRYRDVLELSTGAESLPGVSEEHIFLTPNRRYEVGLLEASEAIHGVLTGAVQELRRRLPDSARIGRLVAAVEGLASPDRQARRMAWLTGFGESMESYASVAQQVDKVLESAPEEVRERLVSTRRSTPLVVAGSAYARLMFGALSPTTTATDVAQLTHLLLENYVTDATPWLSSLNLPLDLGEIRQWPPGEQGSLLGEQACELLAVESSGWVDIDTVLSSLHVFVTRINLEDEDIRAVSVFGPTQRPHIFCNRRTRWGTSGAVERFTLAHELCHLLLDREYGDELAVASGPWAPVAIEQRANAFAAAFLMPTWLLRDALASTGWTVEDPGVIKGIAGTLRVSVSSLIDRLHNLGAVTFDDRLRLRLLFAPGPASPTVE